MSEDVLDNVIGYQVQTFKSHAKKTAGCHAITKWLYRGYLHAICVNGRTVTPSESPAPGPCELVLYRFVIVRLAEIARGAQPAAISADITPSTASKKRGCCAGTARSLCSLLKRLTRSDLA